MLQTTAQFGGSNMSSATNVAARSAIAFLVSGRGFSAEHPYRLERFGQLKK
jgi:hypothetical protein